MKAVATILCNRAAAHLLVQEPELAFRDARAALAIEPSYPKAMHRSKTASEQINANQNVPIFLIKRAFAAITNTDALCFEKAAVFVAEKLEPLDTVPETQESLADALRERGNMFFRVASESTTSNKKRAQNAQSAIEHYTTALAMLLSTDRVQKASRAFLIEADQSLRAEKGEKFAVVCSRLNMARDSAILAHIMRHNCIEPTDTNTVVVLEKIRVIVQRLIDPKNEFMQKQTVLSNILSSKTADDDAHNDEFNTISPLRSVQAVVPLGAAGVGGISALLFCRRTLESTRTERGRLPHSVTPLFSDPDLSATSVRPEFVHARLGNMNEERIKWWLSAQPRDVDADFLDKSGAVSGVGGLVQPRNFQVPEYVVNIRNGVSIINCADLSIVADAEFDADMNEVHLICANLDPNVIAAMRIAARVAARNNPEALLQVMYSETWSAATYDIFIEEVKRELKEDAHDEVIGAGKSDERVVKILSEWADRTSPIPLKEARTTRFSRIKASQPMGGYDASSCWLFQHEADRDAVAAYELSGDVPAMQPGEERVGSLVAGYDGMPSIFGACRLDTIVEMDVSPDETIVDIATRALRLRCAALCEKVQQIKGIGFWSGKLIDIADKLAQLSPETIVWGNIDELPLGEFHALARKISASHTLHVGHSARWLQATMGAALCDVARYPNNVQATKAILKLSGDMVAAQLSMSKIKDRFHLPVRESPIISTGAILLLKFGPDFAAHFAKVARKDDQYFSGRLMPPLATLPILPASRDLARITWTYSEAVVIVSGDDSKL